MYLRKKLLTEKTKISNWVRDILLILKSSSDSELADPFESYSCASIEEDLWNRLPYEHEAVKYDKFIDSSIIKAMYSDQVFLQMGSKGLVFKTNLETAVMKWKQYREVAGVLSWNVSILPVKGDWYICLSGDNAYFMKLNEEWAEQLPV